MTASEIIRIENLAASLGRAPVIAGLSATIAPGEFVGLIGPNGAGKSTLLRAMAGLLPVSGRVAIGTADIPAMKPAERAMRIAYVPQDHEIAWPMPVEALVALGRTPHRGRLAGLSQEDREAVRAAMARMDVERFAMRPATELSGGEKARVLIARALAQETPVILADEPTSGLDPAYQISLMRLFRELAGEGRTVIASLHDLGLAARWCTRLLLLEQGRIVADGAPEAVLTAETLRRIYGVTGYFSASDGHPVVLPLDLVEREPR